MPKTSKGGMKVDDIFSRIMFSRHVEISTGLQFSLSMTPVTLTIRKGGEIEMFKLHRDIAMQKVSELESKIQNNTVTKKDYDAFFNTSLGSSKSIIPNITAMIIAYRELPGLATAIKTTFNKDLKSEINDMKKDITLLIDTLERICILKSRLEFEEENRMLDLNVMMDETRKMESKHKNEVSMSIQGRTEYLRRANQSRQSVTPQPKGGQQKKRVTTKKV